MKRILVVWVLLLLGAAAASAQGQKTKYGIVPVWPQGWEQTDKANWYDMMSSVGMGYLHTIYTWEELERIRNNGQLPLHFNYLENLREKHDFTFHLLLRNPSISYNALPPKYSGLTFEDTVLVNAFYDFCIETVDDFAPLLDYLTIGGEADPYFAARPEEIDNYVNVLERVSAYIDAHYPSIQFATTLTLYYGILENDELWQRTKDFSDMLSVTYWPLNEDFTVSSTAIEDMPAVIQQLLEAAEGKPVIIKESGLPSSEGANGSEALQSEFVEALFRHTVEVDQIKLVGWDFLADFDEEEVDYWVDFQRINTPEFRAYIGSLGLMDPLGRPKPAYAVYLDMLEEASLTSVREEEPGENSRIEIYPNPSPGRFTVEGMENGQITVFNLLGEIVCVTEERSIDLTGQPAGTYFIRVATPGGIHMRKVIVK